MCTAGSWVVRRMFPSLSTSKMLPSSAAIKLAPLIPISAERNFCLRMSLANSVNSSPVSSNLSVLKYLLNNSDIVARLRWIAGATICDGCSFDTCNINSAKSVSATSIPAFSRAVFNSISSDVIDFDFTISFALCSRHIFLMYSTASLLN